MMRRSSHLDSVHGEAGEGGSVRVFLSLGVVGPGEVGCGAGKGGLR